MKNTRPEDLIAAGLALTIAHAADITPAETKAIAEEGFIYGLPIVMNYAVMYEYAVDHDSGGIEALLYRHGLDCQKVSSIRWAN
jgi:hypothetical protein